MVIGALLLPIVFVGAPEAGGPEAVAACVRECAALLSGVCAKATEETMAKAVNAMAACRTREITPPAKKRSSPEINSPSSSVLLRMSLCVAHSLRLRTAFFYRHKIVRGKIVQHIHVPARPANFKRIHQLVFPQPEKDARILRRAITHPALHLIVAPEISRGQSASHAGSTKPHILGSGRIHEHCITHVSVKCLFFFVRDLRVIQRNV